MRGVAMALKNIGDVLASWGQGRPKAPHRPRPRPRHSQKTDRFFDFLMLVKSWPQIVGPKLAKRTLPLRVRRQELFIMTAHPLYAQQLQHFEQDILHKIAALFANSRITKIGFQATEYFDVINSQQQTSLQAKDTPTDLDESSFHPYDPKYQSLKKKVQSQLPAIADPELYALLEKMNIVYYEQRED